jgi:hypothetical protein
MGQRISGSGGHISFTFHGDSGGGKPGILYERNADNGTIRITNNTPNIVDVRHADLDRRFGTRLAFTGGEITRLAPGRWFEVYEAAAKGWSINRDTW